MELEVRQAKEHDVYRDVVRIPEAHRLDHRGRSVKEGSICWITIGDRRTLAWVRGAKWDSPSVSMDELLRRRLKADIEATVDVELRKATILGEIRWGLQASEAAYRVATMLALLSVALGLLSVLLAFTWTGISVAAALSVGGLIWHHVGWWPRSPKS